MGAKFTKNLKTVVKCCRWVMAQYHTDSPLQTCLTSRISFSTFFDGRRELIVVLRYNCECEIVFNLFL